MNQHNFNLTPLVKNDPTRFWMVARDNYRLVKIAFEMRSIEASLMLAQQSFELYVKGILALYGIKYEFNHDIIKNMKKGIKLIETFKELYSDPSVRNIIELLGKNFTNIRYGKATMRFDKGFFKDLDAIEEKLDYCFFEKMKQKYPKVHYKNQSFEEYRKIHKNRHKINLGNLS